MLNQLSTYSTQTAGFIQGRRGRLFTLYFPAQTPTTTKHLLIHCPALADEMNKSRAMLAAQARAFAQSGIAVLLIDLWGTGDSEGEFLEADWLLWRDDFIHICQTLQPNWTLSLWGLRTGALMALELAHTNNLMFNSLLLWQPVFNGELFLQQWLRLRIAGQLQQTTKEKTAELKQRLLAGETLEVGGYAISTALAVALTPRHSDAFCQPNALRVALFELTQDETTPMSPLAQRWLGQQNNSTISCTSQTLPGIPFWNSQDIVLVDELIRISCAFFASELT